MKRTVPAERQANCPGCGKIIDSLTTPAPVIEESRVLSFCSVSCRDDFRGSADARNALKGLPTTKPFDREETWDDVKRESFRSNGFEQADEHTGSGDERLAGNTFNPGPKVNGPVFATGLFLGLMGFFGLAITGHYLVPGTWSNNQASAGTPETNHLGDEDSPELSIEVEWAEEEPDAEEKAGRILEESLESESLHLRMIAAEALLHSGESEPARRVLLEAAKDALWTRRQQAAAALARLGDEKGVEILEKDMDSYRSNVRRSAVFALSALGEQPRAIRRFLYRAGSGLAAAEAFALGWARRGTKTEGNGRLESEVQAVLEKTLNSRQSAPWEKERAAAALGMMKNPAGKSLLKNASRGESLHLGTAIAMARLEDDMAEEALVEALKHSALRFDAAAELARMGKRADTAQLEVEMASSCEANMVTAAAALIILTLNQETEAH